MSGAKDKNRKLRKKIQKEHEKSLSQYSDNLELIAIEDYKTKINTPNNLIKAYVSKKYFVQLYQEKNKPLRISIIKNKVNADLKWEDGLTWDEIQNIKNEIGFENNDCVEIYPAQQNVVNVANMRHIWVMNDPLPFSWKNGE